MADVPGISASDTVLEDVNRLEPHPQNPRQGDVGVIAESIEVHGLYRPIVVQRSTGYVLAGNHTLKAAVSLGMTEVPVVYLDVDDDEALRILLVDNRASDVATYDDRGLADLLTSLATNTPNALIGTGFDGDDLDDLLFRLAAPPFLDDLGAHDDDPDALNPRIVLRVTPETKARWDNAWQMFDGPDDDRVRALLSRADV